MLHWKLRKFNWISTFFSVSWLFSLFDPAFYDLLSCSCHSQHFFGYIFCDGRACCNVGTFFHSDGCNQICVTANEYAVFYHCAVFFLAIIPGGSDRNESACNVGDLGLIPGLGRSLGEGHGNPLQYSCLENPHGQRSLWARVHGVAKSQTQLSIW